VFEQEAAKRKQAITYALAELENLIELFDFTMLGP